MDDIKDKYIKACRKLHLIHNDYMLLLCEASQHERDFRLVLLPELLEFHQIVQEELAQQWYNLVFNFVIVIELGYQY